ncbi:MAG: GAF domain-containing protein [Azonexaceae bacterium]|nr:GAF domain-containing protein [Azonexaceae bacterium]
MEGLNDLFRRLEQLNDIGASLSSERNIDLLLEKILLAAKDITRADGGTLYRLSEDGKRLHFEIVRTDSLNIAFGGSKGEAMSGKFPDLPLHRDDGAANDNLIAVYAALNGKTVNIADAYTAEGFDFSGTRRFDERTGYRSQSFLTVPMKNHEGEIIGVLQLLNAIDPASGKVTVFSDADQRLAESLASQAAIALTNRQLVEQLESLFESFIKLINLAIDEKSAHTGGHCQRVPELTMMLADAAEAVDEGPLADFKLSDKERYELRIAALMHDCGKVTTPVHVVDKATKLQTIFDRIELVDTRFEVLRQQAEARKWRSIAEGEPASRAEQAFANFCGQLDVDREFLRRANFGGERMRDEDIERVRQIATQYRWTTPSGEEAAFLSGNEIENLTIRAGTLTQAEREIINYHIVATIKMLEQLPWPKHLKNVPEYAGGHHERMDGKGYPKGLTRDQMSWQARMMGIADIFEALTAKDRPYKEAMKLSQALSIMENFRNNGHIDPDLHEVFVKAGVFRRYGESFLDAAQRDV